LSGKKQISPLLASRWKHFLVLPLQKILRTPMASAFLGICVLQMFNKT